MCARAFEQAQVQIKTAARTIVAPMCPQHTAVASRYTLYKEQAKPHAAGIQRIQATVAAREQLDLLRR